MTRETPPQGQGARTNEDWFERAKEYSYEGRPVEHIVLERGRGIWVWDVEGNQYMDFESGQMTQMCGHAHPKLLQAIRAETENPDFLMQTKNTVLNVPRIRLAEKLAEIAPGPLKKSYFCCTGGESVEAAVRLAKKYTGRFEVVAVLGGYHGRTLGSASYSSAFFQSRRGYGPHLPGAIFMPPPYCYRCWFKETPPCNLTCLKYTEELLDHTGTGEPAAVLMEFVIGSGGMFVPPVEWMTRLSEMCKERGMLLIDDESMTGIGRTGKWFACQHFPVVPDILTTSKGLGGGVPLAACVTTEEIGNGAVAKGHAQSATHMGDPFQCAIGLANLRIVEEERLAENAAEMGELMREGLREISERCEALGDVRGLGLFTGVEFVEDRETKKPAYELTWKLVLELRRRGVLIGVMPGGKSNLLRLCPPLVITKEEVELAVTAIEESLAAVTHVSKGTSSKATSSQELLAGGG